MLQVRICRKTN